MVKIKTRRPQFVVRSGGNSVSVASDPKGRDGKDGARGITFHPTSTTNETMDANNNVDHMYLATGNTSLTLPSLVGRTNAYIVKNVGTGIVTVVGTIDGYTNYDLYPQESYEFRAANGVWIAL